MKLRSVYAFLGILCLMVSIQASNTFGQTSSSADIPELGLSVYERWLTSGATGQKDRWSVASLDVGWMTVPNGIHLGYDGLVLPGACISSFFVYPLSGVQVGASVPMRLANNYDLRIYGSYLIPNNPQADQELTWTNNVPGTRVWRHSDTVSYKIGGEGLFRFSPDAALVLGFRLESLLTTFSDPNPNYIYTASWLQAQTTVTIYEPYVGIRLQQSTGLGALTLHAVGFPLLFANIQHLNVCDNSGVPFAHTGSHASRDGFFVNASAEYRIGVARGLDATGFLDWNVYQGHCTMTIDRHEGGPTPGVTSGAVAWSHLISSLVIGARAEIAW